MRGLYAIIDPAACAAAGRLPLEVARHVLRGGCAALQLRDKLHDDASFVSLGRELSALCRSAGVPFFVNDRFWLATELGAAGVHVGQSDAPLEQVRRQVGPNCAIGLSTHSLQQATEAAERGAHLIGFGPVFETRSKLQAEPVVGRDQLARACAGVSIPVVAIGGVTLDNAALIASAGAKMGAAIAALCSAHDPELAARCLHERLSGGAPAR
jgi:thiamine-phosphate pyrophosphorylase